MARKDKAKAAGVSASSFLALKAELSKAEDAFSKAKAGAPSASEPVFADKKKTPAWMRTNKGVKARAARDVELDAVARPTLESARAALERKAKIYDKLRRGKSGGLSEAQYETLLVDFDAKPVDPLYESDSDDVDESLAVPRVPAGEEDDPLVEYEDEFGRMRTARRSELPSSSASGGDDPIVEYEDEFGRMRSARRSEVPRDLLPEAKTTLEDFPDDEDPDVIYNPTHHFPTYQPDAARLAVLEKERVEAAAPLAAHYDGTAEVRARGAGFYQFSGDEATRARQMEELKARRMETERGRKEAGAGEVRPGDVEGMRGEEGAGRGVEKRKRELEERRRLVDAKRRRVKVGGGEEGEGVKKVAAADPFAAVESGRGDEQRRADDFLAQLERDVLGAK